MANELSWRHSETGETLYATIRSAARTMWNGSALETLTVANWGDYDIALAETPASSYFHVGDWPAGLSTAGWYWVDIYSQAGASPAISDTLLGTLYGYWNGTKFEPAGGDVAQVNGTAQTARDLGNALPSAAPGANGGLPTTNGTKINQTADLTAGQTIAATVAAGAIATDAITADAVKADAVTKIQSGLATSSALTVVKELLDTTAVAELAADPGATPAGIIKLLMLLYMKARNAETVTSAAKTVKNNAGATILTHALSDDGTTFTKGKVT